MFTRSALNKSLFYGRGRFAMYSTKKMISFFDSNKKNDFLDNLKKQQIMWEFTGDPEYPFAAKFDNLSVKIRINDFPIQPLYSLIIDGKAVADMDSLSKSWQIPFEQIFSSQQDNSPK